MDRGGADMSMRQRGAAGADDGKTAQKISRGAKRHRARSRAIQTPQTSYIAVVISRTKYTKRGI